MKLLFSLALLFSFSSSIAQTTADSLQNALATAEGELKVKTLNELFRAYTNSDPVKALEYAQQALELAKEINDQKGMAAAYNNLGVSYRSHGALDNALEYYIKSLQIYETINNKEGIATSKNNIGNVYSFKKEFPQAMKYLEESHKLFVESGDTVKIVGSLNNLGNLHSDLQLYEEALKYYTDAYELSKKRGSVYSDPLNNIGNLYFKQGNYEKAAEYYNQSLELARKENNLLTKLNVFASLGEVYARGSQFKQAQVYLDSALSLSSMLQAYIYEPNILKSLGYIYFKQGKTKEAYEAMVRYDAAREKVYGEESTRKIAQMEIALDLQEKEKELEAIKSQSEIQRLALQNTRMVITLVILSIGLVIGGFNLYYHKHKTRTANIK
jgi:tetratricopeptide (TPR) repeat protein